MSVFNTLIRKLITLLTRVIAQETGEKGGGEIPHPSFLEEHPGLKCYRITLVKFRNIDQADVWHMKIGHLSFQQRTLAACFQLASQTYPELEMGLGNGRFGPN